MSANLQEILDVPREFLKDGMAFINRSEKREACPHSCCASRICRCTNAILADRKEFIKISQAVGVGFIIMG